MSRKFAAKDKGAQRRSLGQPIAPALLAGAIFAFAFPAWAQQTDAPPTGQSTTRPAPIDRNGVLILIRTTLVAVQQANQSGNYSALYGISAPGFQAINTPAHLAELFAALRAKNYDLSGVVVLEPQLTVLPELNASGVMHMAGYFPSVPLEVNFDLQFTSVEGRWRLLGIAVNVGPSAPVAPSTEPPHSAGPPAGLPAGPKPPPPVERRSTPAATPATSTKPKSGSG